MAGVGSEIMKRRRIVAMIGTIGTAALGLGPIGCVGGGFSTARVKQIFAAQPVAENPLLVPVDDFEAVWNKTVAEVGAYFEIASENRLARTIITEPKISATMFEPWLGDTVTLGDRLEASLQTIRRFAIIKIEPAAAGGYLVKVEVHKELEDLAKPDRQAMGRAVFNNEFPVNRPRLAVGPVPVAAGWIPRGRDSNLEQAILAGVRNAFFL